MKLENEYLTLDVSIKNTVSLDLRKMIESLVRVFFSTLTLCLLISSFGNSIPWMQKVSSGMVARAKEIETALKERERKILSSISYN